MIFEGRGNGRKLSEAVRSEVITGFDLYVIRSKDNRDGDEEWKPWLGNTLVGLKTWLTKAIH